MLDFWAVFMWIGMLLLFCSAEGWVWYLLKSGISMRGRWRGWRGGEGREGRGGEGTIGLAWVNAEYSFRLEWVSQQLPSCMLYVCVCIWLSCHAESVSASGENLS